MRLEIDQARKLEGVLAMIKRVTPNEVALELSDGRILRVYAKGLTYAVEG